jgi:hypothetical protein
MANGNVQGSFANSESLDPLQSVSVSPYANALQIVSKRTKAQYLQLDLNTFAPTFIDKFTAGDLTATNSTWIEDYLLVNNEYGFFKLFNNSFVLFTINSNGNPKYYQRRDVAKFVSY